jgi:hypothetical protein
MKKNTDFKWLINDRIQSVHHEDETGAWNIAFQGGGALRIECIWRLVG